MNVGAIFFGGNELFHWVTEVKRLPNLCTFVDVRGPLLFAVL